MSRNKKINLAKMLILLSFLLIFTGVSFYFDEKYSFQDPIKDTTVIGNVKDNSVSITTTDNTVPEGNTNSSDNSSNFNPNHSNSNSNSNSVVAPPSETITIEQENSKLKREIADKYGISVGYGSEIEGYQVGGLSTVSMSDPYAVRTSLQHLNNNIQLYPTGFFQEIERSGFQLSVYLIKRYSTNNVTGVTDSSTKNVVVSIATDYSFSESFNHEIYHYIDNYISYKGGTYSIWNNLNPIGYQYGTVDGKYSYAKTGLANAYFVNNYAQTDQYEDRSSTFEYLMAGSKVKCLEPNQPIWLKARYMSEQLDLFFNTVSPNVTEYWERFVY